MLNVIDVNLNTDILPDKLTEVNVKIMSQDINNNQFVLRFKNGAEIVNLDDSYAIEIFSKFEKAGTSILTPAGVKDGLGVWTFDTSFITQDESVTNYVYVRKLGSLVLSADANAFRFSVGLSEIDKGARRVAEVYDDNYQILLEKYQDVLDEAVDLFKMEGDAEISDWRSEADAELEDILGNRIEFKIGN